MTISLFGEAESCNIVVEDQGQGISELALEKIFQPFYRDKSAAMRSREGNGLGLAIAKAVVDAYSGTINIESKINLGTRVHIKIPLFYNLATT